MFYYKEMDSIVGKIKIICEDNFLVAVWIEGQSLGKGYDLSQMKKEDTPILIQTEDWLKRYFSKQQPNLNELPIHLKGSSFQLEVWNLLCEIPYGKTTTYKALAVEVAKKLHKEKMSAQAIGGAVGRNPISIIVPCHRVVGTNGNLVGYNGGISIKEKLLELENSGL